MHRIVVMGIVLAMAHGAGACAEAGEDGGVDAELVSAEREPAAPEPAAPAEPSCHPSYEGACLDPSSPDYDCEGGSGDGPDYTGPVRVVGDDPYGLDRDGDGYACESS